jgi:hypothetical protein
MKQLKSFLTIALVLISLSGCEDNNSDEGSSRGNSENSNSYQNDGNSYQSDGNSYQSDGNEYGTNDQDAYQEEGNSRGENDYAEDDDGQERSDENSEEGSNKNSDDGEEEKNKRTGDDDGVESDTNYNYRFSILGDVNATISGNSYAFKAAYDYKDEALPSGYTADVALGVYHIQIAGYQITGDAWNKEAGEVVVKFDMPDLNTTGTYKLKSPDNESGEVNIMHIEPYVNDSYFIVGTIDNAQIYTKSGGTTTMSMIFQLGIIPVYK